MKKIGLVDCDSFFASCEQLVNPTLIGQPVCVMSNNDGCVVARSKEAKKLGVKMGMPVFQARKLFPQVHYITGNLGLYGEISERVMHTLKQFTPIVEIYSIDEAFIDLSGLTKLYGCSCEQIGLNIRNTILGEVGIPVSVGISTTKVLAKLATGRAKKTNGAYEIYFSKINDELKQTNISSVWGIGVYTQALLKRYGINTCYDFIFRSDGWIQSILGKKGIELKQELSGISIYPLSTKHIHPKSIQRTSSFGKFTSDKNYIKNSLNYHAHRACKKLRRLKMKTRVIGIMLRTKDFRIIVNKIALVKSTDWEFEVYEKVSELFEQIYNPYYTYRSSGIYFENLVQKNEQQLSLFDSREKAIKTDKLMQTLDKIEYKYGKKGLYIGNSNIEENQILMKNI